MTLKKYFLLFILAFTVKLVSCYYISSLGKCVVQDNNNNNTVLASKAGDAYSYLDPIDNLLEKGEYFLQDGERKVSIGRAPYYGTIYFLFRLFLSPSASYEMVALFQIFCEAIAIVYLALLSQLIIKRKEAFMVTYLLMVVSMNSTIWSFYLITESLSISFLIIFCYYYYIYLQHNQNKALLLSSLFLCFVVLLKPYFGLLYIPIGIQFLSEKPFSVRRVIIKTFTVSGFLIVLSAPFAIRNFIRFNTYQPFSEFYAGYNFTKATFAYRNFVQAWGGSLIFWDKRSAACYFEPKPDLKCEFVFPDYAFCSAYSMQDIENVKNLYLAYQQNRTPALEDSVCNEFNRLTSLYRQNKPFNYYFLSRLILTKQYLFHSGSYYLPIDKASPCYKSYQFPMKFFQSLLYYFSLIFGFASLIFIFTKDIKSYMLLLIPAFLILFFPVLLRLPEFRYFAPSYPFLILGCTFVIMKSFSVLKKYVDKATVT